MVAVLRKVNRVKEIQKVLEVVQAAFKKALKTAAETQAALRVAAAEVAEAVEALQKELD